MHGAGSHIGVNQLGDALTKSNVSIDYVGRLVHFKEDFVEGRASACLEPEEFGDRRPHLQKEKRNIYLRRQSKPGEFWLKNLVLVDDIPYYLLPPLDC
jgi:hypothetical protein